MIEFLRRRIVDPIVGLLKAGITPGKIALSLAFGIMLGIFPVLGTTTVLVTIAALIWRLNLAAIHAVHFAMTPLQILLIIPFVRVGEHLVNEPPQPLSIQAGRALIAESAGNAAVVLWDAILHAMIGWLAIGPIAIYVLYRVLVPVLERVAKRLATGSREVREASA
jgi:uncharacterized protein (DUF2062 family)